MQTNKMSFSSWKMIRKVVERHLISLDMPRTCGTKWISFEGDGYLNSGGVVGFVGRRMRKIQ